jgi:hypothetical protein
MKQVSFGRKLYSEKSLLQHISTTSLMDVFSSFIIIVISSSFCSNSNNSRNSNGGDSGGGGGSGSTSRTSSNSNNNSNKNKIHRMSNVNAKLIPLILGATGTTAKSFRHYLSNVPGEHEIKELQRTAISGNLHILRKVLTQKYKIYLPCEITSLVASTATTLYTLQTQFVAGIVTTLHKDDNIWN